MNSPESVQKTSPLPSTSAQSTWEPVVRWSQPEEQRAGTHLVVFLHGYGADENDLFSLATMLPAGYTVASVRAPMAMDHGGFTWFPLLQDFSSDPRLVATAVSNLQEWVASQRPHFTTTTLLGFSMGMTMATSLLRREPTAYAGIIGLSGFVLDTDVVADHPHAAAVTALLNAETDAAVRAAQPQVFWGRDPHDPIIDAQRVGYTRNWLEANTQVTTEVYSGVGHGIHPQEVHDFVNFLQHITAQQ